MNILPKKKWHVRTKDNIARVRRDEQQAADEETERQRRTALAEQEARTDFLRKQARTRVEGVEIDDLADRVEDATSAEGDEKPLQHVNIFEDAEQGKGSSLVNLEHEQEKKAEQEKYEKGIGYLTYLGQSAQEAQHVKPWYTLDHDKRTELRTSSGMVLQNPGKNNDEKLKTYLDPLEAVKRHLGKSSKSTSSPKPLAITASTPQSSTSKRSSSPSEVSSKKSQKPADKIPDPVAGKSKTIEELRHERLRREEKERQRTKQFLAEKSGTAKAVSRPPVAEYQERRQKYNSQFNPGIARQNIESERHGQYQ